MNNVFGLISERKSVRTFDSDEITPLVRDDILRYARGIKTPYGQEVDVRMAVSSLRVPLVNHNLMT